MNKTAKTNLILLFIVALICVVPLLMVTDSEFGGADGEAEEMIQAINPDYEPWFEPVFEPPGNETESLLFCLQAALGVGVICYFIGYMKGKKHAVHR